jgi:hypothetical protein
MILLSCITITYSILLVTLLHRFLLFLSNVTFLMAIAACRTHSF